MARAESAVDSDLNAELADLSAAITLSSAERSLPNASAVLEARCCPTIAKVQPMPQRLVA